MTPQIKNEIYRSFAEWTAKNESTPLGDAIHISRHHFGCLHDRETGIPNLRAEKEWWKTLSQHEKLRFSEFLYPSFVETMEGK